MNDKDHYCAACDRPMYAMYAHGVNDVGLCSDCEPQGGSHSLQAFIPGWEARQAREDAEGIEYVMKSLGVKPNKGVQPPTRRFLTSEISEEETT